MNNLIYCELLLILRRLRKRVYALLHTSFDKFPIVIRIKTKASALIPGSLFLRWNSMRFFARGSLYDKSSVNEVRFATLYRQSSNTSRILKLVRYTISDLLIRSRTCRHCEISKKLTLNPTLSAKNTPLFLFPYMGTRLKYLPKGCPYMLVYSALHIMQWFSDCLDVFTTKCRRKNCRFYIFMNQSKCRLHKTSSDR